MKLAGTTTGTLKGWHYGIIGGVIFLLFIIVAIILTGLLVKHRAGEEIMSLCQYTDDASKTYLYSFIAP